MRRDPRAFLWDMQQGGIRIEEFLHGVNLETYLRSALVRSAVERQLQIIGDALAQLARADPELASRVPHHSQVIAFRNVLVHGYASLDHRQVWRVVHESMPALKAAVDAILGDLPNPPPGNP